MYIKDMYMYMYAHGWECPHCRCNVGFYTLHSTKDSQTPPNVHRGVSKNKEGYQRGVQKWGYQASICYQQSIHCSPCSAFHPYSLRLEVSQLYAYVICLTLLKRPAYHSARGEEPTLYPFYWLMWFPQATEDRPWSSQHHILHSQERQWPCRMELM